MPPIINKILTSVSSLKTLKNIGTKSINTEDIISDILKANTGMEIKE